MTNEKQAGTEILKFVVPPSQPSFSDEAVLVEAALPDGDREGILVDVRRKARTYVEGIPVYGVESVIRGVLDPLGIEYRILRPTAEIRI